MPYLAEEKIVPSNIVTVRQQVTDYLLSYHRSESQHASSLHQNYGRLWETITTYEETGGKRIRPYLVVAAYEAFGGHDNQAIIRVAAAWECIHTAMLMHDDVIDRDYIRHGQPNIAGSYLKHYASIANEHERLHHAHGSAILAGDLMVSAAYRMLAGSNFPPEQIRQACELLHEAIFMTVGGELLDVEAGTVNDSIDPLLVARLKTAHYSLIGPLVSGALLAGATDTSVSQLRKLGTILGIGFQLVDDMLGVYGDQAVTGKPAMSDLEEGKRSFVIVEAIKLMPAAQRQKAESLLRQASAASASELYTLLRATAIDSIVSAKIDSLRQEAETLVRQLKLAQAHQAVFMQLIDMLLDRKS